MSVQLNILFLEDQPDDVKLMLRELRQTGFEPSWQRVYTEPDYLTTLQQAADLAWPVDVILADYNMPQFNATRALQLLQERELDIPFLVVTGSISEEVAVGCMKQGAADYLLKSHLRRLGPAVVRALEQKQLREDRRRAEAERERLIEELNAFAYTVAHDLKNPLFVLTGTAQLLEVEYKRMSRQELKQSLQTIVRNGRKMNNIVDELLLLAGLRQQEIHMEPLDMASIIAEAQQRLSPMIETCQAQITMPPIWPAALGYGPWVEEVWVNYLSNGLKYGGQPPQLELGATEEEGWVNFWIHDNGPGLTPEEQARLFRPFTRLNQVRLQGHGLGLSIARRIVEKLGGQVGVESNGMPGQGSVFRFRLPRVSQEM